MSIEGQSDSEKLEQRQFERYIELIVDPASVASESEKRTLAKHANLRAELEGWRKFVEQQRKLVEREIRTEQASPRSRALTDRILQSTTRSRAEWFGDLRLIRDWVLSRCQQSLWVRLAAASLILHLAALPVLAWYLMRDPIPEPQIFFELPSERMFEPAPIDDIAVEAPDARLLLEDEPSGKYPPSAVSNARRRARYVLQTQGAPAVVGLQPTTSHDRLLAARSAGINRGDWSSLPDLDSVGSNQLELALLAEAWLDRVVLEKTAPALSRQLRMVLSLLNPKLADPSAVQRLTRRAASRALELGLADEDLRAGWRTDLWYEASLVNSPERGGRPFTDTWFTQLEQATSSAASSPILDAWLDWHSR